ncbi:MAG: hypothetical protein R6W68_13335 [Ignavibacteriaceae bacterium]
MNNRTELRNKILTGIRSAVNKLIDSRAKDNDYLIVSRNGKIEKIPARKLKHPA